MSIFNAFSPLNGGALNTYQYKSESPFDLDSGLDYIRETNMAWKMPFPNVIGWIEGIAPLHNNLEWSIMRGKNPYGPMVGPNGVVQGSPVQMVFPNVMGSLMKVGG